MRNICFLRVLLIYSTLCLASSYAIADVPADFGPELRPLSGLYTNAFLHNMRIIRKQTSLLPPEVGIHIARVNIEMNHRQNPFSVNLALLRSYVLLDVGVEGMWSNSTERMIAQVIQGTRAYVLIGNLYTSCLYAKAGYDFMPFGHHVSSVIDPKSTVTRQIVDRKMFLIGAGADYSTSVHQIQSAFSCGAARDSLSIDYLFNTQYRNTKTIKLARWLQFRCLLGGGVARVGNTNHREWLLNMYHHTNFNQVYDLRFECLSKLSADPVYLYDDYWVPSVCGYVPDACTIELSRHLFTQSIQQSSKQWMLVVGYEFQNGSVEMISHLFSALKLELLKKRVTLAPGIQWDFSTHSFSFFGRMGVSLY